MLCTPRVHSWRASYGMQVTHVKWLKASRFDVVIYKVGRCAVSVSLGGRQPLSSSATNLGYHNRNTPGGVAVPHEIAKAMTLQDIQDTIDDHVHAAKCAIEAGFDWREPGCSMCLAMNPDQLMPKERCASTSNRNFEGRQGREGRTHLVSPAIAAASAINGKISLVEDLPNG